MGRVHRMLGSSNAAAVWRPLSQMLLQPSAATLCCSAATIPQHLGEALRGTRVVQVYVSLLGWVVTQVVKLRGVAVVRIQRGAGVLASFCAFACSDGESRFSTNFHWPLTTARLKPFSKMSGCLPSKAASSSFSGENGNAVGHRAAARSTPLSPSRTLAPAKEASVGSQSMCRMRRRLSGGAYMGQCRRSGTLAPPLYGAPLPVLQLPWSAVKIVRVLLPDLLRTSAKTRPRVASSHAAPARISM
eukprot:scaffold128346_cov63-Phaeocystis_antarctica.AAC.1